MHDSVYEIAGDDPRIAKLLRARLSRLAEGPAGPLQEMAESVLSGHQDLRLAAESDAYGSELGHASAEWPKHLAIRITPGRFSFPSAGYGGLDGRVPAEHPRVIGTPHATN